MRTTVIALGLCVALPALAQESPGFFDRLFQSDTASSDEEKGSYLEQLLEEQLSSAGRQVTVSGFEGALTGAATLDSLTIADAKGVWLTLTDAELDWNRAALFQGRIEVTKLTAAEILLPRLPEASDDGTAPTPEATGFQLPELPVSIAIDEIAATRVALGAPILGLAIEVTADGFLSLDAGDGEAKLDITRLDGRGSAKLDAGYSNATKVLALDLAIDEAADGVFATLVGVPGRPALSFGIEGTAPIDSYSADIRLATDGADRLRGQITSFGIDGTFGIAAKVGGDIAPLFLPRYRPFFGETIDLGFSAFRTDGGGTVLKDLALRSKALTLNGEAVLGADGMPRRFSVLGEIAAADASPVLLPLPGPETRVDRATLDVKFDAAEGEAWGGAFDIDGLTRDEVSFDTARLRVLGQIITGNTRTVTADLGFQVENLDLGTAALQSALGNDLAGAARIDWADGRDLQISGLTLEGADYGLEGNLVVAPGEAGPKVDGTIDLRADRLAIFSGLAGRTLGGAAELDATFTAIPLSRTFDITATGSARDLSVDDPRIDKVLSGPSRLDMRATRSAQGLELALRNLTTEQAQVSGQAKLTSGGSTLDLTGRLEDGALILPGLVGALDFNIRGREDENRDWDVIAELDGPSLQAATEARLLDIYRSPRTKAALDVSIAEIAPFSEIIGRPVAGALEARGSVNLSFDLSTFEIDGTLSGDDLKIGIAEVDTLLRGRSTLEIATSGAEGRTLLSRLFFLSDAARAEASGVLQKGASQIDLSAQLANIAPFAAGLNGPVTLDGSLEDAGDNQVRLALVGTGPAGISARATGTAAGDFSTVDIALSGNAPLQLANRFIAPTTITGPSVFDLRLTGPLTLDALTGRVSANGARLVAPVVGLALSDLAVDATLARGRIELDARGAVDRGGRISVTGPIDLGVGNTADLALTLNRVAVTDPRLFETSLDGGITIVGPLAGGARIAGDLALGPTEIRIPSTGLGGAGAIPEITHVNEPPRVRGTRRRAGLLGKSSEGASRPGPSYPLDIRITAPNQLFLRGRGLDSEFGGTLLLRGTSANVVPLGGFELIRGRLDILGRRLDLSEARITMQGSRVPWLRLVATTQVEDTSISVTVTGPADNPDIAFTASPDLPQEEVLARLIFGRGVETLSALQAARLALAVRTLAGRGGEGVVSRIRGSTGLDDLDVTTAEDGTAAVRAGAYLNENLYTDVTIDSAGETRLNLNLDVTPSLTVRGGVTSDGETSLGIFFERDY